MRVTTYLTIDFVNRTVPECVHAVQCDANTRAVAVTLMAGGVPWNPPEGAIASVAFERPSGNKGWYDQLPDGSSACTVAGNEVTAILAPEMLTVPGRVKAFIVFQDADLNQISTFGFTVEVDPNATAGNAVSNSYYKYSTMEAVNDAMTSHDEAIAELERAIENGESEGGGKAPDAVLYTPQTLTPEQQEQARENIGVPDFASIEGAVLYTPQTLTDEQKAQARENIGAAQEQTANHEMYFDIDDDGVIALKAEYRGASTKTTYPLSISDNGAGKAGSKNAELPEHLVIPDFVGEIPVNALADAMFRSNTAVKEITLPASIKTLPETFAYEAKNLQEVHGTENIETIKVGALGTTRIKKAIFPNLKAIDGVQSLYYCAELLVADIGNTITSIPKATFQGCAKLHTIRNGEKVTTIADNAFYATHRLKTPAFVPNLTSVGKSAFEISRVSYEWASLTNCTFGTLATSAQLNPTDYWSNCTFTECNTPLLSTFDQENPLWVNTVIDSTGRTFDEGCVIVCSAVIYSALNNQEFTSPVEFLELVRQADPTVLEQDTGAEENLTKPLEAMGFVCSELLEFNETNLQTMYDALASGKLVIAAIAHGGGATNHAVVFHGINANGEVLVCDSYTMTGKLGIYEADRYAMPIQNIAKKDESFFAIVYKN